MGAASLAVALVSLAWECYTICRSDPTTFASLRDDLDSLHSILQLVKRDHSEDIAICKCLIGCDQVLKDIRKALDDYARLDTISKKLWRHLTRGPEDVKELRHRLAVSIHMLHISIQ